MATKEMIEATPMGRAISAMSDTKFVLVRIVTGGYEVECGWGVEESYDGDYMSYTYHPFKNGRMQPWEGRKVTVPSSAEAAELFNAWKQAVTSGWKPTRGERIGPGTLPPVRAANR